MYVLIIAIHTIFISISYLLWYQLLEGIFFLLCIFFLFYFSPLFFIDQDEKKHWESPLSLKFIFERLSPRHSLIIPITLLYIAVYSFLFSIFWVEKNVLLYHTLVVFFLYSLFFVYSLLFFWKTDVFFEALRFHTLFTLASSVVFTLSLIIRTNIEVHGSILHIFLAIFGCISATFLLFYTRQEKPLFLWIYLAWIFSFGFNFALWISPTMTIPAIFTFGIMASIVIFEFFPEIPLFQPYSTIFRYFSLLSILVFLVPITYLALATKDSLTLLSLTISAAFFVTIHHRYTNYIVFLLSILSIFLVYSLLFFGLLRTGSLHTVFLFVFLLPLALLLTTFFWEEEHVYDFIILHYSSIAFSVIFSIYVIFFVWWAGNYLFITSLCIFGVAILFFLSYFRFRRDGYPSFYDRYTLHPHEKSIIHPHTWDHRSWEY